MNRSKRPLVALAFLGAILIAGASFAIGQVFGEGAGVPVLILATAFWVPAFVAFSRRKFGG